MSQTTFAAPPAGPAEPLGASAVALSGRSLALARIFWIAVTLCTGALLVASIPVALALWQRLCTGAPCPNVQLTADQAQKLQAQGLSLSFYATFWVALSVLLALGYFVMAGFLFWRRSDNWLAWLGTLFLVTFGATFPNLLSALAAVSPSWGLPAAFLHVLGNVAFVLFFCLFPTGRFAPRWARWVAVVFSLDTALSAFFPATILDTNHWPLPFWPLAFAGIYGSVLFVMIYRYRRVLTPVQRQQAKWVVSGGIAGLACTLGVILVGGIFFPEEAEPTTLPSLAVVAFSYLALLLIPASFVMAILRSHLWEIDALINKALVYGSLTALLGALYAGLIIGLESLAGVFTQQASDPVVLVISTLAIAALAGTARRRIQRLIDRRFYRKKYDAEKTLAAFSATLRNEVNLEQVREQLLAVVQETMQPSHVSLWLRQPEREKSRPV
jgi:hypothetical protein